MLTYIQALFSTLDAAEQVKNDLPHVEGVRVHRQFVIRRDTAGYRVDGRFHGELPHDFIATFLTATARLFRRTTREEDGIAIEDAEQELAVGQSALVALIEEPASVIENATDDLIHASGGTLIRIAPGTLDAEDHERFFAASSLAPENGEPYDS